MEISIGNLIDQLGVVNHRIWVLEDICRNNPDMVKVGEAKMKINKCNQLRTEYIQAIDKYFGKDTGQADIKIYG